jgi:hypothetical protein
VNTGDAYDAGDGPLVHHFARDDRRRQLQGVEETADAEQRLMEHLPGGDVDRVFAVEVTQAGAIGSSGSVSCTV